MASGSKDNTIGIWKVSTGELVKSFRGHCGEVSSVVFSPNGESLVSGSDDKTIGVWSID